MKEKTQKKKVNFGSPRGKKVIAKKAVTVSDIQKEKLNNFLEVIKNIDGQTTAMQDIAEGAITILLGDDADQDDKDIAFHTLLSVAFPD